MHPHWRFPNLTLLFISLLVTIFLLTNGYLEQLTISLGDLGYVGVFISGIFFISTFTVAPAAAVLFELGKNLDPYFVAVIGGLGAALGDYLAYKFIRDRLLEELSPILRVLHLQRKVDILHTKFFAWLAPVVGAAIIASPLPDEIGLSLLGLKKISFGRFVLLAFCLNAVGIFLIALAAQGS